MGNYKEPELLKDLGTRPIGEKKKKVRFGLYKCGYCGKEFESSFNSIKSLHTKSCGCLRGEKHGLTSHKFYQTWNSMLQRCNITTHKQYKHYGGRGIKVCEEWLDVKNFIEWVEATHPNIEGVSLDRIDNDKGYSPDNCRWADATTQNINQRISIRNTSGYVGICYHSGYNIWVAYLEYNKKRTNIGSFKTIEEAVEARDNYIISNNLPHKLSSEYKQNNEPI